MVAWILILLFPGFWFSIFSDEAAMLAPGIRMLKTYFFGFVFMAEPISNVIGGLACYLTMRLTIYKKLEANNSL